MRLGNSLVTDSRQSIGGRRGALIHSCATGRSGLIRSFWATGNTEVDVLASSMEAYFDFDTPEGEAPHRTLESTVHVVRRTKRTFCVFSVPIRTIYYDPLACPDRAHARDDCQTPVILTIDLGCRGGRSSITSEVALSSEVSLTRVSPGRASSGDRRGFIMCAARASRQPTVLAGHRQFVVVP
jgi:hypothetical protein